MSIAINNFVYRQTADSRFSHYNGTWDELLDLVKNSFDNGVEGDRKGTLKVPVSPEGFYTSLVTLTPDTKLSVRYETRQEGEDPVKFTVAVTGEKIPAKSVEIILYLHELLAADGENSSDADWEIISINASPTEEGTPITPGALMRNFFGEVGGTQGGMTDLEFVEQLRISRKFWRDKVMYDPGAFNKRAQKLEHELCMAIGLAYSLSHNLATKEDGEHWVNHWKSVIGD